MSRTNIEWTRNPDGSKGETWPVVTGCTPVSEGCRNCYAARMAATRLKHHPRYEGLATIENGKARWTGEIRLNYDVLEQPLRWRKPRRIFVASMSDLFHEGLGWSAIEKIFMVMTRARQHTFQLLTKRAERMYHFVQTCFPDLAECSPHIWGLVTAENQATADERIPWLLKTPFAVRGVSVEPCLSAVNLIPWLRECGGGSFPIGLPHQQPCLPANWHQPPLDWVICGGESGPGARPIHPDWARSLRDQCQAAGVPFFFKQHGAWLHESQFTTDEQRDKGLSSKRCEAGNGYQFVHISKKRAGHLLDGREHLEFPVQPKDIIR